MNREIKYNFWCEEKKEMYKWIENFEEINIVNGELKPVLNNSVDNSWNWYKANYIPLQHTGMIDDECKEIVEGDIVEVTVGNITLLAEIVFEIGSFMISMHKDDLERLYPSNWNDNVKSLSELYWEQEFMEDNRIYCLKVVGNRYQHKGLLGII